MHTEGSDISGSCSTDGSGDDLEVTPVKGIKESDLDKTIDDSLDKMYSRIDVLHRKGKRAESKIRSRLKDFDMPDADLDELPDISKLRSKLDRLKDLEDGDDGPVKEAPGEKPPARPTTQRTDSAPPSFAPVIKGERPPAKAAPTEIEKPSSFAPVVTKKEKPVEAEKKVAPHPVKKEEKTGEEKKRSLFGGIKKRRENKRNKKREKKDGEIRKAAESVDWEEETKTPLPETSKMDPAADKGKKEKTKTRKKKKRDVIKKRFPAPEEGEKERLTLRQIALRRREKKIMKRDQKMQNMEVERKKMVKVSDRIKIRREMATPNERHIIDNLAHTGVELAPIYRRFVAYIIDLLVVAIFTMLIMVIIPQSVGLWLIFYVFIGIVYFSFTEGIFSRGLGKRVMNIYVTNLDFEYIGFGSGLIHAIFKSFPPLILIDSIFALINPLTKQRLSNKWTDTIVISGY